MSSPRRTASRILASSSSILAGNSFLDTRTASAPFGVWSVRQAIVLTSYLDGTDPCAVAGIVCQDDVAVLLLNTSSTGDYPGTATGWYGYGWNGFGFTANGLTHITQIGYPVCLDNGFLMERNDSLGFQSVSLANNTIIGSLMCGGASGGPWLVNFGLRPALTSTTAGTAPNPNIVVGVTSWGFTSTSPKQQGASPFTSGNIVPLVNAACTGSPSGLLLRTKSTESFLGLPPGAAAMPVFRSCACERRGGAARAQGPRAPVRGGAVAYRGGH